MDYSAKGILTMLQDLQRENFGKVSMYVDVINLENNECVIAVCVFDRAGEPHTVNFYSYQSDEVRKNSFIDVQDLINTAYENPAT